MLLDPLCTARGIFYIMDIVSSPKKSIDIFILS